MELACAHLVAAGIEEAGYHVDASGVADEDNIVAKLIGTQVNVEGRAVRVDYEFRFGNNSFGHGVEI